nr:hypothetical protein [Tanacetum cinerariifolium]
MLCDVQPVLKEFLHLARLELSRRQADVVNHQQRDLGFGASIEVGRRAMVRAMAPTRGRVQLHGGSLERESTAASMPVMRNDVGG